MNDQLHNHQDESSKLLQMARVLHEEQVTAARAEAERIVQEAHDFAARVVTAAETEAIRIKEDSTEELAELQARVQEVREFETTYRAELKHYIGRMSELLHEGEPGESEAPEPKRYDLTGTFAAGTTAPIAPAFAEGYLASIDPELESVPAEPAYAPEEEIFQDDALSPADFDSFASPLESAAEPEVVTELPQEPEQAPAPDFATEISEALRAEPQVIEVGEIREAEANLEAKEEEPYSGSDSIEELLAAQESLTVEESTPDFTPASTDETAAEETTASAESHDEAMKSFLAEVEKIESAEVDDDGSSTVSYSTDSVPTFEPAEPEVTLSSPQEAPAFNPSNEQTEVEDEPEGEAPKRRGFFGKN